MSGSQEKNLVYVAITRAKKKLYFVEGKSNILGVTHWQEIKNVNFQYLVLFDTIIRCFIGDRHRNSIFILSWEVAEIKDFHWYTSRAVCQCVTPIFKVLLEVIMVIDAEVMLLN